MYNIEIVTYVDEPTDMIATRLTGLSKLGYAIPDPIISQEPYSRQENDSFDDRTPIILTETTTHSRFTFICKKWELDI